MPVIKLDVPGFPGYAVGTNGTVWSAWKLRRRQQGGRGTESYVSNEWTRMELGEMNNGYLRVRLRKEGKYHNFLVQRLVLLTFVGPCPDGMEALHWDGNKKNNQPSNLRWGTRQDNMNDMLRHGRTTKGDRDSQAVLTEADVLEIVKLLNDGKLMQKEIAELKGVSRGAIGQIVHGRTWGHVTKGLLNPPIGHWSNRADAAEIVERSAAKHRGRLRCC